MNGYYYPKKDGRLTDREAIQGCLDEAARIGRGTVILEGEWTVDGTLYVGAYTTLILRNARLTSTDKSKAIISNSNCLLPRTRTLYGVQRGINILGENSTVSGIVEFTNLLDFTLRGIKFQNTDCGVSLAYVSGGRLDSLSFEDVASCILCGIGTRNCYFNDIVAEGERESVVFSSDRIEGRVVYYYGPDVKNNIVKGLVAKTPISVRGDWCKDVIAF